MNIMKNLQHTATRFVAPLAVSLIGAGFFSSCKEGEGPGTAQPIKPTTESNSSLRYELDSDDVIKLTAFQDAAGKIVYGANIIADNVAGKVTTGKSLSTTQFTLQVIPENVEQGSGPTKISSTNGGPFMRLIAVKQDEKGNLVPFEISNTEDEKFRTKQNVLSIDLYGQNIECNGLNALLPRENNSVKQVFKIIKENVKTTTEGETITVQGLSNNPNYYTPFLN